MLRYNLNAATDTNGQRGDTSFPPFRPITRIQLSRQQPRARAETWSLFSRTCETRFRYRRRMLFILRSAAARKRCHTSLPVSLWFADSRILPGEREFRRTRLRFGSPAFQFRRTFTGIDWCGPDNHKFRGGIWGFSGGGGVHGGEHGSKDRNRYRYTW